MSNSVEMEELTPAEKLYKTHLKNVSLYQKRNPDKIKIKCKRYLDNMKQNHPEKYQEKLQKQRDYYKNVRKPKLDALKSAKSNEEPLK